MVLPRGAFVTLGFLLGLVNWIQAIRSRKPKAADSVGG